MPILTNQQRSAFSKGIAVVNDNLPLLDMLRQLADADPSLTERVQELEQRMSVLKLVSETALQIDRTVG